MSCSPDEYERDGVCCRKCSKGTRVSANCNKTSETKCEPCPAGLYMDIINYVDKCLFCKPCSTIDHLQISKPCTSESETVCECMKDYYCTKTTGGLDDHCESCKAVHRCPPGQGVSVPPNSTHNTVCSPCPAGTFNNKIDSFSTCQNHTRCLDLGRYLTSEGTTETDAICGNFLSGHHWIIPASLWAGLILTLLLVFIGFICVRSKRRKTVKTLQNSEPFFMPPLPPDVIKYPGSIELQIFTKNSEHCAEENDGTLECDGVLTSVFSHKHEEFSFSNTCMTLISDPYRSEPQEDDWPGL